MSTTDLRHAAQHEAAVRTIRARLTGARFELQQALEESAQWHMGASFAIKLDRALMQIDHAMKSDALKQ